ncbi:MAG: tetratricopeptide repeat protein [Thermodesulfobacteriota bacterium]|nr:tetratricopeptide repeat protein [Thermodesulfobacteriota bacterium]
MKLSLKNPVFLLMVVLGILWGREVCYGQLSPGQMAPVFSLKDLKGQTHDLSQMKERPMVILYFFDVDSRPSQEGLLSLNQLAKQYKEANLTVWALTLSSPEKAAKFSASAGLVFPILPDRANVSNLYHGRVILPTVCLIGPGLKVLDYFQGGGKTTEMMLVRLAERQLQQKQTKVAKAISAEVVKKNPKNLKAKTVRGYAALKEENLKEAEEEFKDLAQKGAEGEILGKEGLAAVYVKKGQAEKALQLAQEVEQKAPQRAYVHVVKGDLLYAQDKKKEAEAEYQAAIRKEDVEPYQDALRYNQMGRYYANLGQYSRARDFYDRAITIDPYYIEGTTNKGITYEKEGKWDKALEAYRQSLSLDKSDTFAAILAKKAQEMLEIQKDAERKKRIDQLVKDLAARYRMQKETAPKIEDTWTSPPMVLSFVDFQEKGGLAERDGFSTVLMAQLADHLNSSGRVRVVERVLIDRLLEELNLGSSDLANPETALKLGKVLAAKLIGTGSLYYLPQGTLLSLRLIDTETSAIPQVTTRQLGTQAALEKELFQLNREILKTVILKYPLRGYLVRVAGDQVIVNLGAKQGVVSGTKFDVLEEAEPIKYKGKVLQTSPKAVAQVEVVRVEPDLCFARVLKQEKPLQPDSKVQEKIEETAQR